jgi:uncharacterized protein YqgC (DUF456 family)
MEWISDAGIILLQVFAAGLCLVGLVLSCLSISGTWLVCLAAILTTWLTGPAYPGWIAVATFLLLSVLVEGAEFAASSMGVMQKGGSKQAGWAAFGGALIGTIVGSFFLPPIGSLIGMLVGSFVLVYIVEKKRLENNQQAVDIATGAVVARVLVIFLKVGVTLGMIIWMAFSAFV